MGVNCNLPILEYDQLKQGLKPMENVGMEGPINFRV